MSSVDDPMDMLIDRVLFGAGPPGGGAPSGDHAEDLSLDDAHEFEVAAAAAALALSSGSPVDPMPKSLRRRLEDDAIAWLAESRGMRINGGGSESGVAMAADVSGSGVVVDVAAPAPTAPGPEVGVLFKFVAPWLVAAACLAFVVLRPPAAAMTPQDMYVSLTTQTNTSRWNWTSEEGVTGDVVWDPTREAGVMRLAGLPANDPTRMQYQLWIVDGARPNSPPIDGGVFDIPNSGGPIYVPVDAKLPIFEASAFAITTEPPGGVVEHQDDPERGLRFVAVAAPQA